jgi:sterol 14-demethylase
MTYVFGKGVVYDAEPKKRVQQMQHMSTALRSHRLKAYVPKIEDECVKFFEKWGDSGEINLLDALSQLTILTASRCLHGDDVRENLFEEVSRVFHDLDNGVTPLSFFFPGAPTAAHRCRDKARLEMVKIFSKVINDRREAKADSNERVDILQVFIDLKYKDGSVLSDEEIVGLLIALLFAGQHTSSITSTWTAFFLIFNKQCQEKVLNEQKSVVGDKSELDFDDLAQMGYLQDCVKESLRLHPPLIMLMRMCMQDCETTFEGKKYVIPKGDIVVTSPAAAGRMDTVFTNPDAFEPERFGEERAEHKTQFAYLAFGGGMHACMGQQFGLLQVKVIMSILFRNFKFEPVVDEFPEPDYTAMVVGPKTNLRVKYTKLPGAFL